MNITKEIMISTLNNDSYSTLVGEENQKLDSNLTNDKIFLLSYEDMCDWGSESDKNEYILKNVIASDYAKSQGLEINLSTLFYKFFPDWILRTPGIVSESCCNVNDDSLYFNINVGVTCGIRPAFKFNNINNFTHEHVFNEYDRIDATCIRKHNCVITNITSIFVTTS